MPSHSHYARQVIYYTFLVIAVFVTYVYLQQSIIFDNESHVTVELPLLVIPGGGLTAEGDLPDYGTDVFANDMLHHSKYYCCVVGRTISSKRSCNYMSWPM